MFTLLRLIFFPAKVGVGSTMLGMKAGYRTGRLLGYRRLLLLGAGVGIGLLVAPTTGAETREKLRRMIEARRSGPGGDVAQRVRDELSRSPRTWHLPQPSVEVVNGTAILRGQVPHETGREDLVRTAAAVTGVVAVDNHLAVAGTNGDG